MNNYLFVVIFFLILFLIFNVDMLRKEFFSGPNTILKPIIRYKHHINKYGENGRNVTFLDEMYATNIVNENKYDYLVRK
jgi:hypothetical protein